LDDLKKIIPMKILILALSSTLLILSSCETPKVPFTQALRDEYQLTPAELKSLQFYVSETIILRRGQHERGKNTSEGTLKLKNELDIEEIIIPEGTPCVVEKVIDHERLAMRFGDKPNEFLVFGSLHRKDGYYVLQALEWRKGRGKVAYGDKYYYSNPGSSDAYLLVKLKVIKRIKKKEKVVSGQSIK